MLKIAVVTRYFPSSAEPAQGRSLYETLRIAARSADIRVFYPRAVYPSLLMPHSRLDPAFSPPDVEVRYYRFPALPLVSRPVNGWMAAHVLMPHVRAFGPDLVFGCFLYPDAYAALKMGRSLGVPVVAMSIGSDLNRIGDPISAAHTRTVLRHCDCLVTVSDDLRTKAIAMGSAAGKTRTIRNGCDLSIFHPRDRKAARQRLKIDAASEVVVYIGRLDLKKGLCELVEAAAALHPSRPGLHVYLVGEGPDRPAIEDAVQSRAAGKYVHLAGGCGFDDVAFWIAASDLTTLPSYMEGCPNVVLEALASGRPVVATNVGGIPEVVNEGCGRLVAPRDVYGLAEAIAEALNTKWDVMAISAQCTRSWSTVAAELMGVFESLVPNPRSAVTTR